MLRRTQHRFCARNAASGVTSGGGGLSFGFGMVGAARLLGGALVVAIGGVSVIILTWPILDSFALPVLVRRSMCSSDHWFSHLSGVTNSYHEQANQPLYALSDRRRVQALSDLLFPAVPECKRKALLEWNVHLQRRKEAAAAGHTPAATSTSTSPSHARSDELAKELLGMEEGSVVVLNGPPRSGKSNFAQRLAVLKVSGDGERQQRPVIYLNVRGFVDAATSLHASLTYLMAPLRGLGFLSHSYIKLCNAGLDVLCVNNGHEHTSFIFTCMIIGHVRGALEKLREGRRRALAACIAKQFEQQQQQQTSDGEASASLPLLPDSQVAALKPLLILDGFEQFVTNAQNSLSVHSETMQYQILTQNMLLGCFQRYAADEGLCSLLIVTDSSVFQPQPAAGGRTSSLIVAANSPPPFLPQQEQPSPSAIGTVGTSHTGGLFSSSLSRFFTSSAHSVDVGRWLAERAQDRILTQQQQLQQHRSSASDSSSVALSSSQLLAAFPSLQRSMFVSVMQERGAYIRMLQEGGSEPPKYEVVSHTAAALRRVAAHKNVPPLMVPRIANWLTFSSYGSMSSGFETSEFSEMCDVSDTTAAEAVLTAMEVEGLVYRVCGPSLDGWCERPYGADGDPHGYYHARKQCWSSDHVPICFVPSDSLAVLLTEQECEATLGSDWFYVDVLVPVSNEMMVYTGDGGVAHSFPSGREAAPFVVPRTVLKRVRIDSSDADDGATLLNKLRASAGGVDASGKSSHNCTWPYGCGVVDLVTGIAATTAEQVERDALCWRGGQLLAPCLLAGAAARDCTKEHSPAEGDPGDGSPWGLSSGVIRGIFFLAGAMGGYAASKIA